MYTKVTYIFINIFHDVHINFNKKKIFAFFASLRQPLLLKYLEVSKIVGQILTYCFSWRRVIFLDLPPIVSDENDQRNCD